MAEILNGSLPSFDLDQAALVLALVRGLCVAALLSAFGTLMFCCMVMPRALQGQPAPEQENLRRPVRRWAVWGVGASTVLLLVWAPLQAASIAGAPTLSEGLASLPAVIGHTRFGHLVLLQLGCLLMALWAMRRPRGGLAVLPLGLALALHAGHTHAPAMQPGLSLLLVSDVIHLLAAGAWLGGLVPLLSMVRSAPPRVAASMCRFYSPMGKWCVVAILVTASIQFFNLIGGLPGLVGTAYGWMALSKIVLFGLLFGFAVLNRYRLAPSLRGSDPGHARRLLMRSIGWQTAAALAVVLAAGILSQLSPSIHDQPIWPFSQRFSLVTVGEDPEFRNEVLRAAAMIGAAILLAALGLVWRRRWFGWAAIGVAGLVAIPAAPHLDLLFVPATPTSFFQSPSDFSAQSILAGARLYPQNCAACHGAGGHGDGVLAAGLKVPPADLTAEHLWAHDDGEMFWWLSHGIEGPEGGLVMPGFSPALTDPDLWALIDFVRAQNAGLARAAAGAWPLPVAAPQFQMLCEAGSAHDPRDRRGTILRLTFQRPDLTAPIRTVVQPVATKPDGSAAIGTACSADDAAIPAAYAVVAGIAADRLINTILLIDADGWLRSVGTDAAPAWLAQELRDIALHPIDAATSAGHHHH